jgi:hypothetical protein
VGTGIVVGPWAFRVGPSLESVRSLEPSGRGGRRGRGGGRRLGGRTDGQTDGQTDRHTAPTGQEVRNYSPWLKTRALRARFSDSAMDVPMAGPVFLQKFHSYSMNFIFISIDRENQ